MTKNKNDWFDTHVKVMTFDDNLEKEKKIHKEIKEACIERWTKQVSEVTKELNKEEDENKRS